MNKFKNQPLVTIGITSFNRHKTLKQTIDSVLNQTYKNIEIIICDDCSTDLRIFNLIGEYLKKYNNIKFVSPVKKIGLGYNLNLIIENAKSKFFLYLNDDDWIDHSYIEECYKFLMKNNDCILAVGKTHFYSNEKFHFECEPINVENAKSFDRFIAFHDKTLGTGNCPNFGLLRLDQINNLKMKDCLGHDNVWVGNIAYFGKIKTLENIVIHRRLGGSSESLRKSASTYNYSLFEKSLPSLALWFNISNDVVISSPVFIKESIFYRVNLFLRFSVMLILSFKKYISRYKKRKISKVTYIVSRELNNLKTSKTLNKRTKEFKLN